MQKDKHILDNRSTKVYQFLCEMLSDARSFRIVSAYFTIYGFELLERYLIELENTKFLFGDPNSVDSLDPSQKSRKTFQLKKINSTVSDEEIEMTPNQRLKQKFIARRCEEWIKQENVEIRSMLRTDFLHGKMYLTESLRNESASIVGSSNFTRRGLGGGNSGNIEINVTSRDSSSCLELRTWFDRLWNDKTNTEDVKKEVLNALRRLGEECSPEFVYYKTLYEIFREEIDVRLEQNDLLENIRLQDTQIWKALYEFQRDGALTAIARLQKNNGCIVADSVGLGKTYTALAVIKFFELSNARVLVLCPKRLKGNWRLYLAESNIKDNPFLEDRFRFVLLSHTDLSRESGYEGNINFADFNWSNFDLLVIDESHNFRNDTDPKRENGEIVKHSRYSKLMEVVLKEGVKTKVLMLSATPVNTSLDDLKNQINLLTTKQNNALKNNLGINNIEVVLNSAQKKFDKWSSNEKTSNSKYKLLEEIQPDFIRLLGGISIARSRRHIQKFYSDEVEKMGNFPNRELPINTYPKSDKKKKLSYTKLSQKIDNFQLAVYRPTSYVISEEGKQILENERKRFNFNQKHREIFLVGMIRTNFLKRLESSAHSFSLTLDRTIQKINKTLKDIDKHMLNKELESDLKNEQSDEDFEDDDEFVVYQSRNILHFRDLDLEAWRSDLIEDKKTLTNVYNRVASITPNRDGKLARLKKDIRERVNNPTINQSGEQIRKMLVFTVFTDTAKYLYENLEEFSAELGLKTALITGSAQLTQYGKNTYDEILTNFSPRSRGRSEDVAEEIDLLIATDCISEGQNLQDCDTVLNYDIHWNPVKLIQRFGRIDRIGSKNSSIRMINYWPTKKLEKYLKLESRVYSRIAMVDIAGTGDDDLLNVPNEEEREQGLKSKIQTQLNFRDEQLKKIKEEIPDLDDLDNSIVISDFTFDDFFSQLMQYLKANKRKLEEAPDGLYAVTKNNSDIPSTGVIFVLRQNTIGNDDKRTQYVSPIHPFYLAYVEDNGQIRFNSVNVKQILSVFSSLAIGESSPLLQLCKLFDSETNYGQTMGEYNKRLNSVVTSISKLHRKQEFDVLKPSADKSGKNPKALNVPKKLDQFDLVSWLVIKRAENE